MKGNMGNNNLALRSSTGEIQAANQPGRGITRDQFDLLKRTIAKDCTDDELALFVQTSERLGLDIFAKQLYAIKRGGRVTFQTGIDGYRLIAERTGEYEGQTEAQWCGDDGKWTSVWLSKSPPAAARVGVYRRGFREPCFAVARWDAYNGGNDMWRKLGDVMLSKCAESLALRKAFPGSFEGVYTREEMAQAERETQTTRITPAASVEIIDEATGEIMSEDEVRARAHAENARQDEEFAPLAEKLIADVANLNTANDLDKHVQYNWGHTRLYPRSKAVGRYWTALQRAGKRLDVPLATLKGWCSNAPAVLESPDDEHGDAYEGPDAKVSHG